MPRVASSSLWLTFAQVSPLAVNILLTPFVIISLGEVQYGLWLVMTSVAFFLGQLDGGVYRTALHLFSRERQSDGAASRASVITLELALGALVCVTLLPVILFPGLVAEFFHAPPSLSAEVELLLQALGIVVAVGLLRGVLNAVLHAAFEFKRTAIATISGYAAYAACMYATLSAGSGLEGIALAYLAQTAVATAIIVPRALKLIDLSGAMLMSTTAFRRFTAIAWRVQVSSLLAALSQQGSLLIVGRLAPSQVAEFGPGATFAQNVRALPLNAIGPIQTRLSHALADDGTSAPAKAGEIQRYWVQFITGLTAVGVPSAYFGVNAWLPLDSSMPGLVAACLLTSNFLALLPQVIMQWLLATGQAGLEVRATGIAVAVLLVLSLTLITQTGALIVALASIVGNVVALAYVLLQPRRSRSGLNPLASIPWVAALLGLAVCTAAQLLLQRVAQGSPFESGALALVSAGVAALPAVALFALTAFGKRGRGLVLDALQQRFR